MKGKVGEVALKLDISKAYNRVSWEFLWHVMLEMGFGNEWIELVMMCLSIGTYNVLVNGQEVAQLFSEGDFDRATLIPLSIYLMCKRTVIAN